MALAPQRPHATHSHLYLARGRSTCHIAGHVQGQSLVEVNQALIGYFTLRALALLKEMEESKEMPEIPQVLMSKEVMKHQIDRPPNIPM